MSVGDIQDIILSFCHHVILLRQHFLYSQKVNIETILASHYDFSPFCILTGEPFVFYFLQRLFFYPMLRKH